MKDLISISSKDLSVVIQGAVNSETHSCLSSVRKYLPQAQIILSTWKNSDLSSYEGLYDILVLSEDPGAVVFEIAEQKTNSLNRILISSRNGIEKAERKYVLRMRSDLVLKNDNVLKLFDDFKIRNPKSSLFKQRIFAYDIFSIKYYSFRKSKQPLLFHISDWCYLGLRDDLLEFFNIPAVQEPDFSRYFEFHKKTEYDLYPSRLWKMSPEQYFISSNALKVFNNLKFENYLDVNDENTRISEDFIINNFRVFAPEQWGIYTLKKQYRGTVMRSKNIFEYYSAEEQKKDYQKYCDTSYSIKDVEFLERLYKIKYFQQLRKHSVLLTVCTTKKKMPEFFAVIWYLTKFLFAVSKEVLCSKK